MKLTEISLMRLSAQPPAIPGAIQGAVKWRLGAATAGPRWSESPSAS